MRTCRYKEEATKIDNENEHRLFCNNSQLRELVLLVFIETESYDVKNIKNGMRTEIKISQTTY